MQLYTSEKEKALKRLNKELLETITYEEWVNVAKQLDNLEGNENYFF